MIATGLSKTSAAALWRTKTPAASVAEEFGGALSTILDKTLVSDKDGKSASTTSRVMGPAPILEKKYKDCKPSAQIPQVSPHLLTGLSVIIQKTLAGKVCSENDKDGKSAAPPHLLTGRLSSPRFAFGTHRYARTAAPTAMFRQYRMYSSSDSEASSEVGHLVNLRVKSIRTKNCLGDKLQHMEAAFRKNPLFRKVKGHPLIPNSAKAWAITEHGVAFFSSLGLFALYHNELNISIAPSLNEASLKVSSRFSCAEFVEDAQGFKYEGKFHRGKNFRSVGQFAQYVVGNYYGKANIYRCDSWLRRKAKCTVRGQDWADSQDMLEEYALKVVGDNGETLSDIISVCPMLSRSKTVKQQLQSKKLKQQRQTQNQHQLNQSQQQNQGSTIRSNLGSPQQKKNTKKMLRRIGEDNVAAQRDLYAHGFDKSTLNDPNVAAMIKRPFASIHLADYSRWKLKKSLVVLQKIFLMQGRHRELDMKSLFEVDRIGNFWPTPRRRPKK